MQTSRGVYHGVVIDPANPANSFQMSLDEALRRSPVDAAYAWAPEVQGGFVYCGISKKPHTGAAPWKGDPGTLKWRPIGGEESWLP